MLFNSFDSTTFWIELSSLYEVARFEHACELLIEEIFFTTTTFGVSLLDVFARVFLLGIFFGIPFWFDFELYSALDEHACKTGLVIGELFFSSTTFYLWCLFDLFTGVFVDGWYDLVSKDDVCASSTLVLDFLLESSSDESSYLESNSVVFIDIKFLKKSKKNFLKKQWKF